MSVAERGTRGPTSTLQPLTVTTRDSKAHNIGGHLLTSPPVVAAKMRALSRMAAKCGQLLNKLVTWMKGRLLRSER